MPYRRLPNTDQARLTALRTAVERATDADYTEQVLSFKTRNEAQRFLHLFESKVQQYHQNFQTKVSTNKQYKHNVQKARMYVSHFIQVLDLAVIRGEIKKEQKKLYHLDPDAHVVPDLSTDEALLQWGRNIIEGEAARISQGGFPIYSPNITKVQVYYDIFKDQQVTQDMHKKTTDDTYDNVSKLRKEADALILDIWNQVELYFQHRLPYDRYCRCREYGVIYYYRTGEKHLTPQTDLLLEQQKAQSPTLPWSD